MRGRVCWHCIFILQSSPLFFPFHLSPRFTSFSPDSKRNLHQNPSKSTDSLLLDEVLGQQGGFLHTKEGRIWSCRCRIRIHISRANGTLNLASQPYFDLNAADLWHEEPETLKVRVERPFVCSNDLNEVQIRKGLCARLCISWIIALEDETSFHYRRCAEPSIKFRQLSTRLRLFSDGRRLRGRTFDTLPFGPLCTSPRSLTCEQGMSCQQGIVLPVPYVHHQC